MPLDAGSVIATLGAKVNPSGFVAYESSLKKAGVAATEAEAASMRGSRAMDAHGKAAGRAAGSMSGFTSTAKQLGAALGVAGVAGVIVGVTKTAVNFDKAMRNVNSIAGLSPAKFKKLSQSVQDLAGPTAQAPETLAKGMYQLVSSGFKADDALKILKSSATAATAGLTDTGTATTAVAAVLNAYHLSASDAAAVSDDLFQTVNAGVLSFQDLAQNIGDVLPFASSLKVGLKEVGAATATMTKAGVSAPETMTRIKAVMSALIKPSDQLQATYKQLGVATGGDLIRKTGSFQAALEAISRATGGSKEKLAQLFPDIRALGGALLLTGRNAQGAKRDLAGFAKDGGAAQRTFNEQSKSTAVQWDKFKANLAGVAITLGHELLPRMNKAIKDMSKWLETAQKNGDIKKTVKDTGDALDWVGDRAKEVWDIFNSPIGGKGFIDETLQSIKNVGIAIDEVTGTTNAGGHPGATIGVTLDEASLKTQLANITQLAYGQLGADVHIPLIVDGDGTVKEKIAQIKALINGVPYVTIKAIMHGDQDVRVKIAALDALARHVATATVSAVLNGDNTVKVKLAALSALAHHVPNAVVLAILSGDNTAKVKLAALAAAAAGVPDSTIDAILNGAGNVTQKLDALRQATNMPDATVTARYGGDGDVRGALESLTQPRTVPITPVLGAMPKNGAASGRAAGSSQRALVGEGGGPEFVGNPTSGWRMVSAPMIADLGASDYVIPTESRYRGRALSLMAHALGIPGFAGGKHGKGRGGHRLVPSHVYAAHDTSYYDGIVSELEGRASDKNSKGHLTASARAARRKLPGARARRNAAHHYADLIAAPEREADINADQMRAADSVNDQQAYNKAYGKRRTNLKLAISRIKTAIKAAPPGKWRQSLRAELAGLQANLAEMPSTPGGVSDLSVFTTAEESTLSGIKDSLGLDALTASTADDIKDTGRLVEFLTGVLASAQANPGARAQGAIGDIAGQLKTAKDDLASLTKAPDTTADTQALLDQSRTNERAANTAAATNAAILAAYTSSGDIAAGGSDAYRAAGGVTVNVHTLHPGDPSTLRAIGDAATAGIGLQAPTTSPRVRV